MAIKNIIFDLGGVIYDIRYENIADKFRSYGITDFEKLYSKASQTDVIDLFEEGKQQRSDALERIFLNVWFCAIDH